MLAKESSIEQRQYDRVERVRTVFEQHKNYLDKRQADIRLRAETVTSLTEGKRYTNILDIGCGDGSISIPLLNSGNNLTLLDISTSMLSEACSRIPAAMATRVKCVNGDFMEAPFGGEAFDLVVCVGVLAHIASPENLIRRIAAVLKPGGTLILECTDGFHVLGQITRLRNELASLLKPPAYKLNVLSAEAVRRLVEKEGLKATAEFRYGLPLPGMRRFLSPEGIYSQTRAVFGDVRHNRNRWLGNQYIYCFAR